MEKILSIIIPSYNSKPFLAKCLDSLLCECTDRLDIIVVNDGSTDGCDRRRIYFKIPRLYKPYK